MTDLFTRLDKIDAELSELRRAIEQERVENQKQAVAIARRQTALVQNQRQTRRGLEVLVVAIATFLLFLLVILTGLRLEFGWGSFALPATLLESALFTSGVAAAAKFWMDRQRRR